MVTPEQRLLSMMCKCDISDVFLRSRSIFIHCQVKW